MSTVVWKRKKKQCERKVIIMPRKTKAQIEAELTAEKMDLTEQQEKEGIEPTEAQSEEQLTVQETEISEAQVPTATFAAAKEVIHTPFYQLNVHELDKGLSDDELAEWNAIYASYRSKSLMRGEVVGVDINRFKVHNAETGAEEIRSILSLVIIGYRVKILIPESEIWASGDERPAHVVKSMVGSTVEYVITNIDREGEVAVASRSKALVKRRNLFNASRHGHNAGDIVDCTVLAVGPKKCLVECNGYDIILSQRDLSYGAIPDLRTEYSSGQQLKAVVKSYSRSELVVSVKEVNPNPFTGADRRHPIGSRRQAVISGKYKGGIFCTLSDKSVCLCLYSNIHFDNEFVIGDRVLILVTQFDFERELMYGRIVGKL